MKRHIGQNGFNRVYAGLVIAVILLASFGAVEAYQAHHKNSQTASVTPKTSSSPTASAVMTPTQSSSNPTGTPPCHTADLSLSIGSAGAAAGTTYTPLVFTNHSSHTCTLLGFPGVSLIAASGAQLGQPASRDSGVAAVVANLAPGKTAHATFGLGNSGNYDPASCSEQSTSVKVYPPNETQALTTSFQGKICGSWYIRPVQPGASD
jgi:hypothetical protein